MSNQDIQQYNSLEQEDEITLKELIEKIKLYWREIWRNKFWVILIGLVGGGSMLAYAYFKDITYVARTTFMVNEDTSSGFGISGILGSLGLGDGGDYNLDKIVELMKSRRVAQDAIFEKVKINGKEDYLANHIIEIYDFANEDWKNYTFAGKKYPELTNFKFTNHNIEAFSTTERLAMMYLFKKILGDSEGRMKSLMNIAYGKKTTIIDLKVETISEDLSIKLCEKLYDKLSIFYTEEAIKKSQYTYKYLMNKVDSIQSALTRAEYRLAKKQDASLGLILNEPNVDKKRLQTDAQIMTVVYGEAVKNMELAAFSLKNATPFFQVIDTPLAPLKPQKESKLKALILGAVLGGFLAALYFIFRKVYRDTMS